MKLSLQKQRAFTLVEILVVITLISIITLWAGQINFKRLSQRQEVAILTNNVINNIETIRNYASNGRGVGVSLETPEFWEIRFSQAWSWSIETFYSTGSLVSFPETNWSSESNNIIDDIYCEKINGSTGSLSSTGIIVFEKNNITLSGCSDTFFRKLVMRFRVVDYTETIEINTLNGVVQKR